MYGVDCWPTYMFPELSKTIERGFDRPVANVGSGAPVGLNSLISPLISSVT